MKTIKIIYLLLILLSSNSFAYKQQLHIKLSEYAAVQSTLNSSLIWSDWGLNSDKKFSYLITKNHFHGDADIVLSYEKLIGYGSDAEDTDQDVSVSRAFSHFFNPQSNKKLNLTPLVNNFTSADWMLEGTNLGLSGEINFQHFSYSDAQYYFYLAFTANSPNERNLNMGKMFQTIGHLVHHIQDMAQPEHTRTDAHCDSPVCVVAGAAFGVDDTSLYEEFTAQMLECGAFSEAPVSAGDYIRCGNILSFGDAFYVKKTYIGGYPTPKFLDPRAYWTSIDKKGLADFSSNNFITTDTPYQIASASPSIPLGNRLRSANDDLPMPDGNQTQTYITPVDVQNIIPASKAAIIEKYKNHKMQFIGLRTFDPVLNKEIDISQMASFSIFTERYMTSFDPAKPGEKAPKAIFSINHVNLRQRAEILLPMAVGYSTGLINQFFRHRLQVTSTSEGVFRVRNATNEYFNGQIHFYYDDNNGQRIAIPSAARSVSLSSGDSITFDAKSLGDLPNRSSKFYAVAVQKTNLTSKPFAAVAATMFDYPNYQPSVCDDGALLAFHPGLGSGNINQDISLGATKDSIVIEVTNSDNGISGNPSSTLTVTKINDEELTCNLVYGAPVNQPSIHAKFFAIEYDPAKFPERKISVKITESTNPKRNWTLAVYCPGKYGSSIKPLQTVKCTNLK